MKCPTCGYECLEPQGFGPSSIWYYCVKCLKGFEVKMKDEKDEKDEK